MRNKFITNKNTLERMLEYCNKVERAIEKYNHSFELYVSDDIFQHACNMYLLQIGELENRLSQDFKTRHNEISWHGMKTTRNISAHEYDGINFNIMWDTLTKDIPVLREQLTAILKSEFNSKQEV